MLVLYKSLIKKRLARFKIKVFFCRSPKSIIKWLVRNEFWVKMYKLI